MELRDYKKLLKSKNYDERSHQKDFLTNDVFDNSNKPIFINFGFN